MLIDQIIVFLLKTFFAVASIFFQNQISIGVSGNPSTFLPHAVQSDGEKIVSDLVFRKLFKYDEGELVNDLVDSWSSNEDDTIYKIKIKKGMYWQDGREITADDVIYSITMYENLITDIEIERLGKYEVSIKLPNPNAILPTLLTIGIEPAHLDGQSKLNPIGSTSYKIARLTREQEKLQSVELISFTDNKIYNRINVKFYNSDHQLSTAYKLGEIDTFLTDDEVSMEGLNRKPITFLGRYYGIIFNTQNAKLDDPEIRKKLMQVLDVESLLKRNYFLNAKPAQGPISYSPYTKSNFKFPIFNPKTELTPTQKSKIKEIEVVLPNTQDGAQIQSFLTESWGNKLGIPLTFQYLDMNEILDKTTSESYDVVFLGYELSPDPDRYNFWHSTQIGNLNISNFTDLRGDKSLEEGRKEYSFEKRNEHYDIFQDVMLNKTPAVFLYHPGKYLYFSSKKEVPIPKKIYYPSDIIKNF